MTGLAKARILLPVRSLMRSYCCADPKSGVGRYNKVEGATGKTILRQVQLTPEEIGALGARFPEFWRSHESSGRR